MDGLAILVVVLSFLCLYVMYLCDRWEREQRAREERQWKVKEDFYKQQIAALEDISKSQRELLRRGKA